RRLEASQAQHELALAEERVRSQAALAEVARVEQADLTSRLSSATQLCEQLATELAEAEAQQASIASPPPPPPAGDAGRAREAAEEADGARKRVVGAEASLASVRGRLRFQEESLNRLNRQVAPAEAELPAAEAAAAAAGALAGEASEAESRLARCRAELEGLQSLWPLPRGHRLKRVGGVIVADHGCGAARPAVLGPLVAAWAAPDEDAARAAATASDEQATVLYPTAHTGIEPGSLFEHVRCEPGFESLASRLLGGIVVGREVSREGLYREPGLIPTASAPSVALSAPR